MNNRGVPTPDSAVYVISVAAELTGLHPQTLRTYERLGLITPGRTGGGGRRYSYTDIELLRSIASLTAEGIGIEGVRRILELEREVAELKLRNRELATKAQAAREALALVREQRVGAPRTPAPAVSRLPALIPPVSGQSMVVWRRGR